MSWTCRKCQTDVDDDQVICWHCGTGDDGSAPPSNWKSELEPAQLAPHRDLKCLRCASPMLHVGRKRFHEGSYLADVVLGDFLVKRETFDVYACEGCGKVEFFATPMS